MKADFHGLGVLIGQWATFAQVHGRGQTQKNKQTLPLDIVSDLLVKMCTNNNFASAHYNVTFIIFVTSTGIGSESESS